MDAKQAAKQWNCAQSTVQQYCRCGYVPGSVLEGGVWRIPNGALRPFVARKAGTQSGDWLNLLKAVDQKMALIPAALKLTEQQFSDHLEVLVAEGYLHRLEDEESGHIRFVLGGKGSALLQAKRQQRAQLLRELGSAATRLLGL